MSTGNAGRYDLVIDQGASFSRVFTLLRPAPTPLPLTSYTARAQIRRAPADATAGATTLVSLTATVTNAAAGEITVSLTPAQTQALTADVAGTDKTRKLSIGDWDLEIVTGTGASTVERILYGDVYLSREVTRS